MSAYSSRRQDQKRQYELLLDLHTRSLSTEEEIAYYWKELTRLMNWHDALCGDEYWRMWPGYNMGDREVEKRTVLAMQDVVTSRILSAQAHGENY